MSKRETVVLVSRVFALLLAVWALVEITYLPEHLLALFHHMSQRSVLAAHDYWSSYYMVITALHFVRIAGLSIAAVLFWKCGPGVERIFSPPPDNTNGVVQAI
jgi:hypothetical protein